MALVIAYSLMGYAGWKLGSLLFSKSREEVATNSVVAVAAMGGAYIIFSQL